MIMSFADRETERLWLTGKNRRLPSEVAHRALAKLQSLNVAENIDRMGLPPANRLKKLSGDMKDYWSIRINNQWRLIFRFHKGDAYDVAILDYH
jgi:toxin HigB-1